MIKMALKFMNENHWYIIAGALAAAAIFWTYGCTSTTKSLLDENRMVCRDELIAELNYTIDLAKSREADLDRQDAVKQSLLDAANIMSTSGSINPSGLINLAASIGGISFGLTQRQKRIASEKSKPTDSA
jgi:hypothetical protein